MNTVREYNDLRVDWMTRENQKDKIRRFWGCQFIAFMPCTDKRYITYLVRV